MEKRYFLRRDGIVMGPFSTGQLRSMQQNGELHPTDELSPDKASWQSIQDELPDLFPVVALDAPDGAWSALWKHFKRGIARNVPTASSEAQIETQIEALPVAEIAETDDYDWENAVQREPEVVISLEPWDVIPGNVIRLLWNAPDAQKQLQSFGGYYPAKAGCLAVLLAVLLTAYGNVLFASRYAVGVKYLWMGSYAILFGMLLLSYLVTVSVNGDFLTASTMTLDVAGFHVVNMALLFLPEMDWAQGQLRLALPLLLYLLFGAAFAGNAVGALRWRLMKGGAGAYPASAVSLIWIVILFFGYIEGIVIPVMHGGLA